MEPKEGERSVTDVVVGRETPARRRNTRSSKLGQLQSNLVTSTENTTESWKWTVKNDDVPDAPDN